MRPFPFCLLYEKIPEAAFFRSPGKATKAILEKSPQLFWRRRRDSTRLWAGQVAALGVQRSNSLNGLPGFHSLPLPFESHSKIQKKTNPATYWLRDFLAEKEGFEPSMGY